MYSWQLKCLVFTKGGEVWLQGEVAGGNVCLCRGGGGQEGKFASGGMKVDHLGSHLAVCFLRNQKTPKTKESIV